MDIGLTLKKRFFQEFLVKYIMTADDWNSMKSGGSEDN